MRNKHIIGYGTSSIGSVAIEMVIQLYLFDFYTRVLGLSPIWAGVAFGLAIAWDAISDVILAGLLIKARQKAWNYSSALLIGSFVLALSIIVVLNPIGMTTGMLFGQLLLGYILVNTGMTLVDLPHASLSAELSPQSQTRNKLLGARMGFGIVGMTIGSVLPGVFLGGMDTTEAVIASRNNASWVLAVLVIIAAGLTVLTVRKLEPKRASDELPTKLTFKVVKQVLSYRAYRTLLLGGVVSAIGRTMNAALALMYYTVTLRLTETDVTQKIFPVFTLSIILSIPFWLWLSKQMGKRRAAWGAVGLLGLITSIAYPLLPAGEFVPPLIVGIIGGVLCGAVFLVDSMITDMIEAEQKLSGIRKEGLFFAVWKSSLKMTRAIAFVIVGGALAFLGFEGGAENYTDQMQQNIALLFGPAVGLCFMASAWFISRAIIEPEDAPFTPPVAEPQ